MDQSHLVEPAVAKVVAAIAQDISSTHGIEEDHAREVLLRWCGAFDSERLERAAEKFLESFPSDEILPVDTKQLASQSEVEQELAALFDDLPDLDDLDDDAGGYPPFPFDTIDHVFRISTSPEAALDMLATANIRDVIVEKLTADFSAALVRDHNIDVDDVTSALRQLLNTQQGFLPEDIFDLRLFLRSLAQDVLGNFLWSFDKPTLALKLIEYTEAPSVVETVCVGSIARRLERKIRVDRQMAKHLVMRFIAESEYELARSAIDVVNGISTSLMNLLDACPHLADSGGRELTILRQVEPGELVRNVFMTKYLAADDMPLYSLDELRDRIEQFVQFLDNDRQYIVHFGLPSRCFSPCRWLYVHLGRLYQTRRTTSLWPADDVSKVKLPNGRLADVWSNATGPCNFADADLLDGLSEGDASRLEALRGRLLDLKIDILRDALDAIQNNTPADMWKRCVDHIARTLLSDEADLCLRIDAACLGGTSLDPLPPKAPWKKIPGGLTNMLEVIGHVEKELTLRSLHQTRVILGDLVKEHPCYEGDTALAVDPVDPYFDIVRLGCRQQLDRAIDVFLSGTDRDIDFWQAFQQRAVDTFEQDLFVGDRIRTKRKLSPQLLPVVEDFADWLLTCHNAGVTPRVTFSNEQLLASVEKQKGESRRSLRTGGTSKRYHSKDDKRLLLRAVLWKHHNLDTDEPTFQPATQNELLALLGCEWSQSKLSRAMNDLFPPNGMATYRAHCEGEAIIGLLDRGNDGSRVVEAPYNRPIHPTEDEERRATND